MLLTTMNQILDDTYQIKQCVKTVLPSVLLPTEVWDFPASKGLGSLDPSFFGSVFPSVELDQPDIGSLFKEFREVQDTHLKNSAKVRS